MLGRKLQWKVFFISLLLIPMSVLCMRIVFSMRSIIKSKPIYPLILPLFFVFHGYTENFDLIPVGDILTLFLFYLLISAVLLVVTRLVYRNWNKAALISFILMAFYFFFGAKTSCTLIIYSKILLNLGRSVRIVSS